MGCRRLMDMGVTLVGQDVRSRQLVEGVILRVWGAFQGLCCGYGMCLSGSMAGS